ncbi:MAG: pyruvate, phosphate dikinase [Pseudomonadota bacterium]
MAHQKSIFPVRLPGLDEVVADPSLQGLKGANLIRMAGLGLPVPPAFVISTSVGHKITSETNSLPVEVTQSIRETVGLLEQETGRTFGGGESPLLLAVRSGAAVSMPGMMDTILNLGLTRESVARLAAETGSARFAWDNFRRFIQSFATVVHDLDADQFEDILFDRREAHGVDSDSDLSAETIEEIALSFLEIYDELAGHAFPDDVWDQLDQALLGVFRSWNTPRASHYRAMHNLADDLGTAAVVQAMVFGNRDENSCTGVYFTRNPSSGEPLPFGEYMPVAQGEDVVSGIRTPLELTQAGRLNAFSEQPSFEETNPQLYKQLLEIGAQLEGHYGDMQEIEFTVESGKLYVLQTRTGKRNANASLRIAVDLVDEGVLSTQQALAMVDARTVEAQLVGRVDIKTAGKALLKGLPASPGAATGAIVFSSDDAVASAQEGRGCILVRAETDPKDIAGMDAAVGILTSRGGMTSHAAVVARSMGKPCITAAMALKIDRNNRTCTAMGQTLAAGDTITIDGASGFVYPGEVPITVPEPMGALQRVLEWKAQSGSA